MRPLSRADRAGWASWLAAVLYLSAWAHGATPDGGTTTVDSRWAPPLRWPARPLCSSVGPARVHISADAPDFALQLALEGDVAASRSSCLLHGRLPQKRVLPESLVGLNESDTSFLGDFTAVLTPAGVPAKLRRFRVTTTAARGAPDCGLPSQVSIYLQCLEPAGFELGFKCYPNQCSTELALPLPPSRAPVGARYLGPDGWLYNLHAAKDGPLGDHYWQAISTSLMDNRNPISEDLLEIESNAESPGRLLAHQAALIVE